MAKTHPVEFELDQRLRVWRRGLVVALTLRTGAWLLLALAIAAVYDLFLPLPENARFVIGLGLPLAALGCLLFKYFPIRRIGRREMAVIADTMLDDPHRSLLSAYELVQSGPSGFLKGKSIADAQLGFFDLPPVQCRPRRVLRAARLAVGAILAAVFLLMLLKPQAVPTLAARLLAPFADIPPYSMLDFQVSPSKPEVAYGGDIEVTARITGGKVNVPVRVLTRHEGETEESECFRGAENRFTQKIEKIARPVEFCFAAGSARSTWHKIRLLLEPRFSLARLTISPPAYTREPVREIVLGREEIKAVHGATASLSITSNRPLAGGEMKIKPLSPHGEEKSLSATPAGVHTVRFDWPMLEPATLQVRIRDVQGTESPAPLEIKQSVLPDDKPRLTLHEPGSHALATPRTLVPVSGGAQDDFGIRRVDFVRTLKGFRECPEELAVPKGDKTYEFQTRLDLSTLGVEPGEVIELYIEGRDENPSLTGIQTSDVSRIEIISEEEYGKMLVGRVSLDELLARFQKIQEQLDRARRALAGAQEAKEDKAGALEKSTGAVRDAADALGQLARDFPAFDMEMVMEKALAESAARARNAADRLGQLNPSQPDLDKQIESIRKQFDGESSELDGMLARRQELDSVGRLFEQAANFMQLVEQQRQLANWVDRMTLSGENDAGALASAAKLQDQLRELAGRLPGQMREAAEAIPDNTGYDKLKADAAEFATRLEQCEAPKNMGRASTAAQNTDAQGASRAARQAHEQLAALLPENSGNQFAGLCRGSCQQLFPQGHALGKTLGQCLAGMMARGRLGALGSGGPADDGYVTQGFSTLELPVFGPQRTRFTPPPRPVITSLGSIRDGLSKAPQLHSDNQAKIEKTGTGTTAAASISLQQIPEKYRSAVRKYFSNPPTPP
jgi:phosphotransferase system HPr-like phosphotransfer protein